MDEEYGDLRKPIAINPVRQSTEFTGTPSKFMKTPADLYQD